MDFGCTVWASGSTRRAKETALKTVEQAHALILRERRKRADQIMKRVDKNESIASIARDLGITRQRVSQIVQRERKRRSQK